MTNCFPKWMRNLTSCEQSNRVSVSLFLYQYFIWSVFLLLAISVSLYSHYIVLIWFLLWLMRWNLNSCSYLPHECLSSSLKHLSKSFVCISLDFSHLCWFLRDIHFPPRYNISLYLFILIESFKEEKFSILVEFNVSFCYLSSYQSLPKKKLTGFLMHWEYRSMWKTFYIFMVVSLPKLISSSVFLSNHKVFLNNLWDISIFIFLMLWWMIILFQHLVDCC